VLDRSSGIVLACEVSESENNAETYFLDMIINLLQRMNKKPSCMYVARPEVLNVFKDFGQQVEIKLVNERELPIIKEFREGMMQQLDMGLLETIPKTV